MSQVTRNNHFVPQAYLRRWADDTGCVYRYRLLVSEKSVPLWSKSSVRGLANKTDLYTLIEDDKELDEYERWFEREFETPAQEAIDRAICGTRLRREDWHRLALYCLAQDLRTPRTYHEITSRFAANFDRTATEVLESVRKAAERGELPRRTTESPDVDHGSLDDAIRVSVNRDAFPERDEGQIVVKALAGRRLWLNQVKRLATGKIRTAALSHEWSIAQPSEGMTWITSDHPVVKLNFYADTRKYDLRGGWGRRNGNILMPLSPEHLLFTEIGKRRPRRLAFPAETTSLLRKVLVESALDDVFADAPYRDIVTLRPRVVDAGAYTERERAWSTWHDDQNQAERNFLEN